MPYYTVTIRKATGGYKWVNAYLIGSDSLNGARLAGDFIVGSERNMHGDDVQFEAMRVAGYKSADPNDFVVVPLTGTGDRDLPFNSYAPPFVAVHVQLTSTSGRPGKKGYRYCLRNTEVIGDGDHAALQVLQPEIDDWEASWALTITAISYNGYGLLMMGAPDSAAGAREVTAFVVAGAMQLDVHHGWFNKNEGA